MGCNCKKSVNVMTKYADNNGEEKQGVFYKVLNFIGQFFFGTLIAAIVLVFIIPLLIYVLFCIIIGKEVVINLRNPFRKKNKNNQNED